LQTNYNIYSQTMLSKGIKNISSVEDTNIFIIIYKHRIIKILK